MTVTYVETREIPLAKLTPLPGNPRRGNKAAINASIKRHGQFRSLIVRDTGDHLVILAGNHTFGELGTLGHTVARCEVIRCDDDEARRITLADNRIADLGDYDTTALLNLLTNLDDLEGVGYTDEELDRMVRETDYYGNQATDFLTGLDQPPPVIPPAPAPANSQPSGAPDSPPAATPDHGGFPPPPSGSQPPAPPAPERPFSNYVQLSWTFDVEQRDVVREAVRAAQQRWQCATSAEAVVALARHFLNETGQ